MRSAMRVFVLFMLGVPAAWSSSEVGLTLSSSTIQKISEEIINHSEFKKLLPLHNYETQKPTLSLEAAPQLVRDYGHSLFGLNMDEPFHLHLKVFGPDVSYSIKIKDVQFQKTETAGLRLWLQIAISKLDVKVSKLWLRELGLTHGNPLGPNACHPSPQQMGFFKDHVFAAIEGIQLSPKDFSNSEIVVSASVDASIDPQSKKLVLAADTLKTNLGNEAKSLYRLTYRDLTLPEVDFKVNGKCFPADLKPVQDFIWNSRTKMKNTLLSEVSELIVKEGTKALRKALRNLTIPTSLAFEDQPILRDFQRTNLMSQWTIASADNTRYEMFNPNVYVDKEKTLQKSNLLTKWYRSFFSVELVTYLAQLQALDTHHLFLGLSDRVSINQQLESSTSPEIVPSDVYDEAIKNESTLIVSKKWIEEKLSLVLMLRLLEKEIGTEGITFEGKGIVLHPEKNGSLSLTALARIDINKVPGFWPAVGASYEYLFGATGGVLHLPLQLNVKPIGRSMLSIRLHRNFDQTPFNEESNLRDASLLVRYFVAKKLNTFADNLESKNFELPLQEIENTTSLRPLSIHFDNKGNLLIGFMNVNLEDRILKLLESKTGDEN